MTTADHLPDADKGRRINGRSHTPVRTLAVAETELLEAHRRIAELEAELEHVTIRLGKYVNIITADALDPQHKVHHHAHGREKAKA